MKLFVLTSGVPFRSHGKPGVTALHVVTRSLLDELQSHGHSVVLQLLFLPSRTDAHLSANETEELQELKGQGVEVPEPIFLAKHQTHDLQRFRSLKLLTNRAYALEHFYSGFSARPQIFSHIESTKPDVILPIWCTQGVAATHGISTIPRVAYHGDIDYEPFWARSVQDHALFYGRSRLSVASVLAHIDRRLRISLFKRAHLELMESVDAIANITARNSDFYTAHGHSHSSYVGNTWVDSGAPEHWRKQGDTIKIIGHVGYLDRTGSTYGLRYLLRDVMPHLREAMGNRAFEVHVIGGAEPFPEIRQLLEQPNIVRQGFVTDLERELQSADLFCLLNNAGPLRAANTRHLVAWASGQCLVAHEGSKEAIPELEHLQNCVLLSDPKQAGKLLVQAATDLELNTKLRKRGRETYEQHFTPAIVGSKLSRILEETFHQKK